MSNEQAAASSPADARMAIMRSLQSMFLEVLDNDEDGAPLEGEQLEMAETLADEMSLEVLETLGLEVVSVDADGSMLVRVVLDDE